MNKLWLTMLAILVLAGSVIGCDSGSGDGAGTPSDQVSWDMALLLEGEACLDGAASSGAGVDAAALGLGGMVPPISYFPGFKVTATEYQNTGAAPEVHMLAYIDNILGGGGDETAAEAPPTSVVQPGDTVKIHFQYQANADGAGGDYFLVRIIDGGRFVTPAAISVGGMTRGEPVQVDLLYTARSEGLAIEIIVGLSSAADAFYFDDLRVRVAGAPVIDDQFEAGDYSVMAPVSAFALRIPMFPGNPAGSAGVQSLVVLKGTGSLAVTGGRSFSLWGGVGSMDGVNAMLMSLNGSLLKPYYGESMMIKQGPVYFGEYKGTDNTNADFSTCAESGNAIVSVDPLGSADLSGWWTLEVLAQCDPETSTIPMIGEFNLAGNPVPTRYSFSENPDGDFYVNRMLMFFIGSGFNTTLGDIFYSSAGLSIGSAGMALLTSGGGQAQLVGSYNKQTKTFQGMVMGILPWGGKVCVIPQGSGQFIAHIQK